MQSFQIIDEKRIPLEIFNKDKTLSFYRWEQRAIIGKSLRRFIVFVDALTNQNYIEEITTGDIKYIEDDSLHNDLSEFVMNKGFLTLMLPILK